MVEDPHECGSICHQLHFSGARKSRTVFKTPSTWVSWVTAILERQHESERSKNPFPLAQPQGAIDLTLPWVSASQILPRSPSPCPRLQDTGDLGALHFWALECSLPLQGIALELQSSIYSIKLAPAMTFLLGRFWKHRKVSLDSFSPDLTHPTIAALNSTHSPPKR